MLDELIGSLPRLLHFRSVLYGILLWSVCFYAFLRGGREERIAIVAKVIGAYLSFFLAQIFDVRYSHFAMPVFWIDMAMFVVMQWIALRSRKFWPMWLAAFAGVALISHLAPFMPLVSPHTYYDAIALWGYPGLILLAFAIRRHRPQMPMATAIA